MSYRERRNRRDEAAAGTERHAGFMRLVTEQARVRVMGPVVLREGAGDGCPEAAKLRGFLPAVIIDHLVAGHAPDWVLEGTAEALDMYDADLSDELASYHGDAAVAALVAASLAVGDL